MKIDQARIHGMASEIFSLRSETMPAWIDNETFAYLDDRDGVPHLFVSGTTGSEPRQITSGEERIQSLIRSPNRAVIVGTDVGGNERQQLRSIDIADGTVTMLTSEPDQMFEPFLVSKSGDEVVFRTNDGESGEFSLWSQNTRSGARTCLWQDAGQVWAHAINDEGDVLASLLTSNLDADLYIVRHDGSREPILQVDEESWILDAAFGPEPDRVIVLTNADRDFVSLESIDLTSVNRSTLREEAGDIETFKLSPDAERIVLSVNDRGYSRVYAGETRAVDGAKEVQLPAGVIDRISWSPDGTRFIFGWLSAVAPSRIYMVDGDGKARPARADDVSKAPFDGVAPETITYTTFDGRRIPAFWFRAASGDQAPIIIDVHGGPESQRRPGFHPVLQFLAASGFNVLTTNVRGSTGYGKAYSHLDDVELRLDSVHDLKHAHKWLAEQVPGSAGRIAVMGQSYGGFMTLSAITEYPDLWFAAVDVVGICNFVTFLERTGPWRRRHRQAEYGSLEEDRELLASISPIRKVDDIAAPLLVIHGKNDPRVPLYEAEQLVASLQERGHMVQSLVFDNEGHGLSKRDNRISGYTSVSEFLLAMAADQGA